MAAPAIVRVASLMQVRAGQVLFNGIIAEIYYASIVHFDGTNDYLYPTITGDSVNGLD